VSPLATFELAGATVLAGSGAMNALLGLALGRTRSALRFAAFFACLTLASLSSVSIIGWSEWLSPADIRWIHSIGVSTCYLLGPLFYAYVLALVRTADAWRAKDWTWHGMPFLVTLALGLANAAWPGFERRPIGGALISIAYHGWIAQGLPYFLAAVWRARAASDTIEPLSSGEAAGRSRWLRLLTVMTSGVWVVAGIKRVAVASSSMEAVSADAVLNAILCAALFFLTWRGLRERMPAFAGLESPADTGAGGARYARSALDEAGRERVADDLVRLMRERHLYTDAQLDLAALSRHSGWPAAYISQALNQHLKQNFSEFVGGFRLAAAKRRLADPRERRTVLDVALGCGFGSKSTFNAAFRRDTHLTPREFRRQHAQAAA
jgi:AraC-like DNA-binding protein